MGSALTRRAVILGKVQSAEGADAVPIPQLNGLLVSDFSYSVNGNVIERNHLRDSLSPLPHRMGRKLFEARFNFELKAGYAAGVRPEWSPLARAAGMQETVAATITSLVSATYKWTVSSAGAEIFYCDLAAGGDPTLANPSTVRENGQDMTRGTSIAALAQGQFAYGDADTLGFSTVYVRLSDGADPDTKAAAYVQHVAGTSVTYDFRDTAHEFSTFYIYPDGLLLKCVDSLIDITDITYNAGATVIAQARLMSKYATPTDATLPVTTNYHTHLPPIAESMAFTIDAFAAGVVPTFSVNFANQLSERQDISAANGLKGLRYTGRTPTGRVSIEQELVSAFPLITNWETAKEMAWSATLGSAGQRLTFSSPAVQISSVESADINNGIRGFNCGLKFNAPTATKEFKIFLD